MGSGLVGLPRRLWYRHAYDYSPSCFSYSPYTLSLTHSLSHSLTHSLTLSLTHSLRYSSDNEIELIRLYISSNSIESAYQEARYELEECEHDVNKLMESLSKDSMGGELLKYGNLLIHSILLTCPLAYPPILTDSLTH